ncbi:beta strand repeat-containing protein [Luteolibacter soli]|uniref:Autotransporter-associated beta strand repeat-containing protein n=1 Tax=Luteolibacter soli TaxID=3135280 RepID=A0ABU9AW43_9BACT
MRPKTTPLLALFVLTASAHGAAQIWDVTQGDGSTVTGGSGTWLNGGPNWNNGTTDSTWATGDTATFQAANDLGTYAVTVGDPITTGQSVTSLTFNNSGYTLRAAAAQTISLGTGTTDCSIRVAPGKTATIGDNLTVKKGGTPGLLGLFGGGTLNVGSGTANGGAVLQNPGTGISFEMRNGTTLDVKTGGTLLCARSGVVGSTVVDTNTHRLKISGGTVTMANGGVAACTLVLGNNTSGQTSTSVLDMTAGELNNQTVDGSLRFGPVTAGNSTVCNATANLDGGTMTVARIFQGAQTGTGVTNSTFNFNGGTVKVLPGTTTAATFMSGLDFAYVKSGGAIINTDGVTGNNGNVVIAQPLLDGGGGGGLTKEGTGTLTLTGASTYTGATTINGGKLAIVAPNSISATTVNNNARLKINSSGATPANVPAVSLNAGSGLEFDFGSYNAANQPALAVGTLNANANYTIDLTGINIPGGSTTITLLNYTTKNGTGTPVAGNLPLGLTLTGPPVDTGTSIQITVATGSAVAFTYSKGDGTWDTSSLNWNANAAAYAEPAVVTFPNITDAVDGINTVTLDSNRSPFSIDITNTGDYDTTAYTFTGAGGITGTTGITKTGSGLARFATPNSSYSGNVTINAGAVIKEAADNTTGNITVATDATFALAGNITDGSGQTITIAGPGQVNQNYFYTGAANQRGAFQAQGGNVTWAGNIALSGTTGTGGTTRIGVQNGSTLTLTGTISEALAGISPYFRAGDSALDTITIAGTCLWTGPTRLYSNGGAIMISGNDRFPTSVDLIVGNTAGATGSPTFDLAGFNQTVAALGGAANANGLNPPIVKNSGLTLSTLTLNPTTAGSFPGVIQDNVKLVVGGTATQTLTGDNTYTADTTINAGGHLTIGTTGELLCYPTTNGLTNSVGGSGTLQYDGTLRIDIFGANATPGNSWTLVNTAGLTVTYGSTFAVTSYAGDFAETEVNSGIWRLVDGGIAWTFTESTGKLSVATYVAAPFDNWIGNYFPGETDPAIVGKDADPDHDGISNFAEFAMNGAPDNIADSGYHVMALQDTNANAQKELTITLAVRKAGGSPVFTGSPLSAISDGVKYTIEGSLDLVFPTSAVSEASPATGPGGLPAEYEYRRFRLNASEGLPAKGFLRVKTEPNP